MGEGAVGTLQQKQLQAGDTGQHQHERVTV